MAYQLRKTTKITEQLALGDDQVLDINIDPSKIASQVMGSYREIILCRENIQSIKGIKDFSKAEEYAAEIDKAGESIIKLFSLVLGNDNTNKVLEYFEGNYFEMLEQLLPFVTEEVLPKVKLYQQEKQKKAAQNYKYKGSSKR